MKSRRWRVEHTFGLHSSKTVARNANERNSVRRPDTSKKIRCSTGDVQPYVWPRVYTMVPIWEGVRTRSWPDRSHAVRRTANDGTIAIAHGQNTKTKTERPTDARSGSGSSNERPHLLVMYASIMLSSRRSTRRSKYPLHSDTLSHFIFRRTERAAGRRANKETNRTGANANARQRKRTTKASTVITPRD